MAGLMLYLFVTLIGMDLDVRTIADNPGIFAVGFFWLLVVFLCVFAAAFALPRVAKAHGVIKTFCGLNYSTVTPALP